MSFPRPSTLEPKTLNPKNYKFQGPSLLGGSGDLVSRLIMGIIVVTIWVIGVINLLTKSP